jgi:hypothetical protein
MTKRARSKVNKMPTALPRAFGAIITFPERIWVKAFTGGWTSRAVTGEDLERRRELAKLLGVTGGAA